MTVSALIASGAVAIGIFSAFHPNVCFGETGAELLQAAGVTGGELYTRELDRPAPPERGIWAAVYPQLLEEIRANRATIVFVNSRGLCERLTQKLNELAGERSGQLSVAKLNVDENQQTAMNYDVMSIPTMIVVAEASSASRM